MKLFEYMSSGSVIIHTGIGSINEVLNENNSFKIDINNLKDSFNIFLKDFNKIKLRALKAREEIKNNYLWEIKSKNIFNFLNND